METKKGKNAQKLTTEEKYIIAMYRDLSPVRRWIFRVYQRALVKRISLHPDHLEKRYIVTCSLCILVPLVYLFFIRDYFDIGKSYVEI